MPDGFHFHECGDEIRTLLGFCNFDHSLHVACRRFLDCFDFVGGATGNVDRIDVMCAASQGSSSLRWPLMMFTTPAGTSLVANTSARVSAASGCASAASATTTLPPHSAGASRRTSPESGACSGAMIATTPVGSGIVKLK